MAPDRIVILNDSSVARGGATGLALLAARQLAARGQRVTWLCGDGGDDGALADAGVEVVALGGARLLERGRIAALGAGLRNAEARRMVAGFVARHDTPGTVYHVHGWAQILSPALFGALAPVAPRTLIHAHDMFLACPNGVYMEYPRNAVCTRVPLSLACLATNCDKRSHAHKLWRVARQRALRGALDPLARWGGVLAIHPGMIPGLVRAGYPETMIRVIRNPATPFSPTRIRAEANAGLAYVGRLEPDKGVGELAEAAARTGQRLTLVGDGPMRADLRRRFPDLVVTGWLERAHIGAALSGARALVMPSRHPEPFALVIAEAAASGLPVLVADTALMAAEVQEAGLGLAFDVFNPASLDAALQRIAAMPEEAVRAISLRGAGGPVRLAQSVDDWIDALLDAYARRLSA